MPNGKPGVYDWENMGKEANHEGVIFNTSREPRLGAYLIYRCFLAHMNMALLGNNKEMLISRLA